LGESKFIVPLDSNYILGVSENNKLAIALIPVNKCILWKVYLGDNCIYVEPWVSDGCSTTGDQFSSYIMTEISISMR
jgi:hypothetical protein